jgi:hypothetical protein
MRAVAPRERHPHLLGHCGRTHRGPPVCHHYRRTPAPSNAASPNDIIYGGFVNKDDLLNRYDSSAELQTLYNYFGISRADISPPTPPPSTPRPRLTSAGRNQHDASDGKITLGSHTYWSRGLYVWDTGANVTTGSSYQVLEGIRSRDGGYFAIMFHCGNIVFKTLPPKPTPPPPPKPSTTPPPATPTLSPKSPSPRLHQAYRRHHRRHRPTHGQIHRPRRRHRPKHQRLPLRLWRHRHRQTRHRLGHSRLPKPGQIHRPPPRQRLPWQNHRQFRSLRLHRERAPPPATYTRTKSAQNLTQNLDATTRPAHAGDEIRYSLTTKNIGGTTDGYTVVEHVEDILEYADITDLGGATIKDGVMTWPETPIAPGKAILKTFTVKVKNPIPATPVGRSDKFSYDLRMDNIYGNEVHINLEPPLAKQVEGASTNLPDTGAPTATLIVLAVSALTLFFYFRNRQLMAEIKLLRGHYQGGGGYYNVCRSIITNTPNVTSSKRPSSKLPAAKSSRSSASRPSTNPRTPNTAPKPPARSFTRTSQPRTQATIRGRPARTATQALPRPPAQLPANARQPPAPT